MNVKNWKERGGRTEECDRWLDDQICKTIEAGKISQNEQQFFLIYLQNQSNVQRLEELTHSNFNFYVYCCSSRHVFSFASLKVASKKMGWFYHSRSLAFSRISFM